MSDPTDKTPPTAPASPMVAVRTKHRLANSGQPLANPTVNLKPIVDNLLDACQTGFILGDSGVGKSPLVYQLGICAAEGIPFLGEQTSQTDVLYLDFENNRAQGDEIEERICGFLKLPKTPDAFTRWHESDCDARFGRAGWTLDDIIADWSAASTNPRKLVIPDPYRYWKPRIEDPEESDRELHKIREIARRHKVTIIGICHPRRTQGEPQRRDTVKVQLFESPREWILAKSRGSGNLISNSDVRLGLDTFPGLDEQLTLAGYRRVHGTIGPIILAKVIDPGDGEPLGFQRVYLPMSQDNERIYTALPSPFQYKDAMQVYGKNSPRAVSAFLKAGQQAGRLRKVKRQYFKMGAL